MRRVATGRVGAALTLGVVALSGPGRLEAQPVDTPGQLRATYGVEFGGISIGTFDFASKLGTTGQYALDAKGELSLLFGAIKWSGEASAAGHSTGTTTQPKNFNFVFRGTRQNGAARLGFTGGSVTSVTIEPPKDVSPHAVPVLPAHLKNVLDPMSASLAITKGGTANPCSRKLAVFNGKERFDLILSPKGTTEIKEKRPSGQPVTAYVCRIKYVPISGHKPKDTEHFIQRTEGIDLVLRPIPSVGIFVPYTVIVPTSLGTIRIFAKSVSISADQVQIALTQ
jgi:hypothetical protein